MELSNKILSDITVYMKYAKYKPELNRRETWEELVTRNKEMHIKKYPELKEEIEEKDILNLMDKNNKMIINNNGEITVKDLEIKIVKETGPNNKNAELPDQYFTSFKDQIAMQNADWDDYGDNLIKRI